MTGSGDPASPWWWEADTNVTPCSRCGCPIQGGMSALIAHNATVHRN